MNPEKAIFHCFGCGEGGDVFAFIMKRDGLDFRAAVESLAERAGVALSKAPPTPAQLEAAGIRHALELACQYYQAALAAGAGAAAREYLKGRGIGQEAIATFRLGYAPAGWRSTLDALGRKGIRPDTLIRAGLAVGGKRRPYDYFRDRLMFPIADGRGRVVGFGARTLGSGEPKYLNSPESPHFSKGRTWYGLHLARDSIRRQGRAVVVEGYTDVVAAHQAGFTQVVASLGTALTRDQARSLHVLSPELVIAYDADAAGQAATWRGLEIFRNLGGTVKVGIMPEGEDPDDLIRKQGPEGFSSVLAGALHLVDYRYTMIKREQDLTSPEGKSRAVGALAPLLAAVTDAVAREAYVAKFSNDLRVPAEILAGAVVRSIEAAAYGHKRPEKAHTANRGRTLGDPGPAAISPAVLEAEKELIRLMLVDTGNITEIKAKLDEGKFVSPDCRAVVDRLYRWQVDEGPVDMARLMSFLGENSGATSLVAMMCVEDTTYPAETAKRVLADCVEVLKRRRLEELGKLLAAADMEGQKAQSGVIVEYQALLKELKGSRTG
ncbi:MAG TPA: DNA primase [Clostridiales bacterium UBA8153]|nr:DNA primase [Clostridiales bacterium UBA8153]